MQIFVYFDSSLYRVIIFVYFLTYVCTVAGCVPGVPNNVSESDQQEKESSLLSFHIFSLF